MKISQEQKSEKIAVFVIYIFERLGDCVGVLFFFSKWLSYDSKYVENDVWLITILQIWELLLLPINTNDVENYIEFAL